MTATPESHWDHTVNEWGRDGFYKLLNSLPSNLQIIYDVGANVGGFTHHMHLRYPEAHLYCFEPVELNYNTLIAKVPYATCFKKGIFYGAKESKALWRGSNVGAFFVEQIDAGEPRADSGMIMELDELESFDIEKPDLIKIDIEGAEENVIAHSSVVKNCPHLIIEWHPSTDPFLFFKEHLPDHEIIVNLQDIQFLLKLK